MASRNATFAYMAMGRLRRDRKPPYHPLAPLLAAKLLDAVCSYSVIRDDDGRLIKHEEHALHVANTVCGSLENYRGPEPPPRKPKRGKRKPKANR